MRCMTWRARAGIEAADVGGSHRLLLSCPGLLMSRMATVASGFLVRSRSRLQPGAVILSGALVGLALLVVPATAQATGTPALVALAGNVPAAVAYARPLGPAMSSQRLSLQVHLPLRHFAELQATIGELSNPGSPGFQRFLSPAQLTARYAHQNPVACGGVLLAVRRDQDHLGQPAA
jgi:hypothetical protein